MYKLKIFKQQELVSLRMYGTIEYDEVIQFNNEIYRHPDYQPHFNGLVDQRGADVRLTLRDMERVNSMNEELQMVKGRWGHLVDVPRGAALTHKYSQEAQQMHEVGMFSTEEALAEYLGLESIEPFLLDVE